MSNLSASERAAAQPVLQPKTTAARRQRDLLATLAWLALLSLLGVAMLLPLAWMVSTALKPSGSEFTYPPQWIPDPPRWQNFYEALTIFPFHIFFRNTLFITLSNVVGTLVVSSMAAYAFARVRFVGRRFWFGVVLATMMLPSVITMVPNYVIMARLGWVDTFLPLIIPAVFGGGAFYIFVLRQFFAGIPRELDEAARLDGAGHLRILVQIILPLARPALTSVAVLTFIAHWNEFLYALIYLDSMEKKTLALGLRMFQSQYTKDWNLMMAASTVVLLPMLLLFFFAQRYFVEGIALTGLSGR
jgi:multiple sugar transport system permease protein